MIELNPKLNKIMQKMKASGYDDSLVYSVPVMCNDLNHMKVNNIQIWLSKLEESVNDKEQYLDRFFEGRVALLLACNEFDISLYPTGDKGPDIRATWRSYRIYVEVSRFREDYTTRENLRRASKMGTLVAYGRGERDVGTFYNKIITKVAQLPRGDIGLAFLGSNNIRIEGIDFWQAVEYLEEQISKENTYTRFSAVFFDSSSGKRFHLWLNPKAERPVDAILESKLCKLKEAMPRSRVELPKLKEHRDFLV